MPHRTLSTLLLTLTLTLSAHAQFARLERYPDIPRGYDDAFTDLVRTHAARVVRSAYGQYYGQVTQDGQIYGYGTFYTDQDGEVTGQYHNGELLFGIRMSGQTAKVGTLSHYTLYDLATGACLMVVRGDEKYKPTADNLQQWQFLQIQYPNGAKYVGETTGNKREGYGIYYYADGDYYYGRYHNDQPTGHGALFRTNSTIALQTWDQPATQDTTDTPH